MHFKLNRSIKTPLYKQIAAYIENGISTGEFSPDNPLPSERHLAKELQVNRSTVVAAYDELQSIGLVERRKGSGTHISTDIWGISDKRIPNWGRYVEDGSFLPNLPLVQKIRTETQNDEMVNMASGELAADLFPSEQFHSIFKEKPFTEQLGYDHPQGNIHLRETISNHLYAYKGITVDAESILITSGAQQALHLIVQCLLKPGDAVAIEDPSYAYSLPLFKSAGLRVFLLKSDEKGIKPVDIIELHKKHRIRMVFINPDFQNPTGMQMPLSRRKRILEISSEYGIPIIEDDPYSITAFNGNIAFSLKRMDMNGNVLYISSLSKIVASGLRIGWIVGPKKVIQRLADAKQQIDFGHSIFPQWVANEFIGSSQFDEHILKIRQQLEVRRKQLSKALIYFLGDKIDFLEPNGGIHLWCRLNEPVDEFQLLDESLNRGFAFVPGSIFGESKGFVRFTYGRSTPADIWEGISRFSKALQYLNEKNNAAK
ncbi:PLP-dependent aminotransferase family protein [Oceanobacillus jeddahense]|uniref:MocR-like pyridoxine biosynthesis transcription factor PdxR n=1 Tax=Oceanobacillus jeddahense TaxID=1462527 RepID=UPI0005961F87|nr:PLP-dependent aminotransferase family protein [Oceanobacillus jeddahense]